MTVIINAGSGPVTASGEGWTNTHAKAADESIEWTKRMAAQGFTDIDVVDTGTEMDGRWLFTFTHRITGKTVELWHPGIDDVEAYQRERVFPPRIYWNGSSCADPQLDDFAAAGFTPVLTFKAAS